MVKLLNISLQIFFCIAEICFCIFVIIIAYLCLLNISISEFNLNFLNILWSKNWLSENRAQVIFLAHLKGSYVVELKKNGSRQSLFSFLALKGHKISSELEPKYVVRSTNTPKNGFSINYRTLNARVADKTMGLSSVYSHVWGCVRTTRKVWIAFS